MNLDTLEKVIELVRRHGIHQVEIEDKGMKISVTATAAPAAVAPAATYYPPAASGMHLATPYAPAQTPPHAPQAHAPGAPQAHAPGAPAGEAKKHAGKVLKSPFVGTFYRSSSPGSDPFCEVGKRVKKGQTLCIIEAMKLMNEIEAEFDGVIKEILVDNEQPVEFDQPLFVLE